MARFADLTGAQKSIEVLRWIAVAPTAVMSVAALRLIASIAVPPALAQPPGTPLMPPSDYGLLLVRVLYQAMGFVFVVAGAGTAPRWRFPTAIVLSLVWIGYSFLNHVFVHLGRGAPHYMYFALGSASAACGALCVYYTQRVAQRMP
jgi:hypothetical protein